MEKSKVSCSKLKLLLEEEIDGIDSKEGAHKAMGEIGEFIEKKEPSLKGLADTIGADALALLFGGTGIATSDPVISYLLYLTGVAGAIGFLAKAEYDKKTHKMLEVDTDIYGETGEEIVENYKENIR